MDKILLHGMQFFGRHGCDGPEREAGQVFFVDVEVDADLQIASRSDDLNDTLNYVTIFQKTREIIEGPSAYLLEHLAGRIADFAMEHPRARAARVRIRKPHVALGGVLDYSGVEIERTRSHR